MEEASRMGRPRESVELLEYKLSVRLSSVEVSQIKLLAQQKGLFMRTTQMVGLSVMT